jgi:hypothetical protein
MKLFCKVPDGGKDSGVTAYFLIEWKSVFSIALLKFNSGSREAYHTHAFNALTWWIKGGIIEKHMEEDTKVFLPSFIPKYTPRTCFHKVVACETSWAFTIRGPWSKYWYEFKDDRVTKLTHGRVKV